MEPDRAQRSFQSGAERNAGAAARKRVLTAESSSRIANSVVRSNTWPVGVGVAQPVGPSADVAQPDQNTPASLRRLPWWRVGGVRGYRDNFERDMKRQRLTQRPLMLASVEARITRRRPKVCVGGVGLARLRHNLPAGLSVGGWRERWDAARRFLMFVGTSGERFGNGTPSWTQRLGWSR